MKKVVAVMICVSMIFLFSANIFASESDLVLCQAHNIFDFAEQIKDDYPNARVVIQDNVLHVSFSSEEEAMAYVETCFFDNRITVNRSYCNNVYSANGGTYVDFSVPFYATFTPYTQVFFPRAQVEALRLYITNQSVANMIYYDLIAGMSTDAIIDLVYGLTGVTLDDSIIDAVYDIVLYAATNLEITSLNNALSTSSTGKVQVVRGMSVDGYLAFIYSPWNSNYCQTYGGYMADWHAGTYVYSL